MDINLEHFTRFLSPPGFFFFPKLKIPFDSFPLHGFDKKRTKKNLGAKTRFVFLKKNSTAETAL